MSEPREPKWRQTVEDIVNQNEIRQAEHLERAAFLEDGYGIPIDELRKIYGNSILNRFSANAEVVERWLKLCETLRSTDQPMVALFGSVEQLAAGRCSLGQEAQNDILADVIIITNPHEATIAFESTDDRTTAMLHATGYRLLEGQNSQIFDDLHQAPQTFTFPIVQTPRGFLDFYTANDHTEGVHTGADYYALYDSIIARHQNNFNRMPMTGLEWTSATMHRLRAASDSEQQPWLLSAEASS